jgi:hypothetical protein
MVNLNGKVAIVTGAAAGLGKAKAEVLAADGAAVLIAAINRDSAENVAKDLVARGNRAVGFGVDVDEVRAGVVDPVVETQLPHAVQLLVARCGRDHGRAGPFGQLDRGHPDASGPSMDQRGLAGLEVPGGEQALLCGAECHRDAYSSRLVQPVRDRPGRHRGDDPLRGVRARGIQGHHPVADRWSSARAPTSTIVPAAR